MPTSSTAANESSSGFREIGDSISKRVVLPFPDSMGVGSFANWINIKRLKKENVTYQLQAERLEIMEGRCVSYKVGRVSVREPLVLTTNLITFSATDSYRQNTFLTLKIDII